MSIQIGDKPDNGFDNPLGLLSDCHRRIERFLDYLQQVADQAGGGPLTEDQRHTLEISLRYFRNAAPRHTQDEEESLFPRMKSTENEALHQVLDKIQGLEADHQRASDLHAVVDEIGTRWLKEGEISAEEVVSMKVALGELEGLYDNHIALEDQEVFPLAGSELPVEQIKAIGCEMAQRRGLSYEDPLRCRTRREETDGKVA
ncbi:MAG: hemerythrin domain-containing protein [Armatimonadetes bacterium]|nr:hemerythrin domain-containing protein [Armatimonadota bacterium]